jgi:hypothetical protein
MSDSDERATVRPVTLARLVETTHVCASTPQTTEDLETALNITHRRARETLLEALRIDLITEDNTVDPPTYGTTTIGEQFLSAVRDEDWSRISDILDTRSPHYNAFLEALDTVAPAELRTILKELEHIEQHTPRSYNQTSVEVVGDWAERLGTVQRNAFSGHYYPIKQQGTLPNFSRTLLAVYDEVEETAGVNLRQRYLSIPQLRETFCERHRCTRDAFDEALDRLAEQNVGRLELSGAPIDTGAKDAKLGIKDMALGGDDGLVSTTQSTEQVMAGIEQYGKQYYYLAVHDRDLSYDQTKTTSQQ